MNAFFAAIKRSPRLSALVAVVAGAVLVPAALLAYGPDRPTYTMASPADHVTFNSITDNPDQGDERNFVRIRQAGVGNYADTINLQAGQEYEVSVFYHNNASSTLNDDAHNQVGIAHDAMMAVQLPTDVKAGAQAQISGTISASNAQPQSVWDSAYASASSDMALRYETGSATVYSKGAVNGMTLSDSILNGGVKLGYSALDGNIPGCNDYEGWVVFKFKAVSPNFQVTKTVEKVGTNSFSKSVNVNPGDQVEYKIQYQNTGSVEQDNVVVKDSLPAGVTYIPGTTNVANPGSNGQWVPISDNNVVTSTGINIGNYGPNSNAYVSFKATVASQDQLASCGLNTLTNTATIDTDNGSKSDTANVLVNKTCSTTTTTTSLPETGASAGAMTFVGLGASVAAAAYAATSTRVRNLLRR